MKFISLILIVWSSLHVQKNIINEKGTDEVKCLVSFSIYNAGLKVTGTIDSVRAIIHFDPLDISKSYVEAWANAATVRTGISIRDNHLKRKDYFDVEAYPLINLKSKSFRKAGRHKAIGDFDVTIKGITRSVPVTFTISTNDMHPRYSATFRLNRLDFNLGEESVILENNVAVDVKVD